MCCVISFTLLHSGKSVDSNFKLWKETDTLLALLPLKTSILGCPALFWLSGAHCQVLLNTNIWCIWRCPDGPGIYRRNIAFCITFSA